jgi:hypothetical protein
MFSINSIILIVTPRSSAVTGTRHGQGTKDEHDGQEIPPALLWGSSLGA